MVDDAAGAETGRGRPYRAVSPFGALSGIAMTVVIIVIALIVFVAAYAALLFALYGEALAAAGGDLTALAMTDQLAVSVAAMLVAQVAAVAATYAFAGLRRHSRGAVLSLGPSRHGIVDYLLAPIGLVAVAIATGYALRYLMPHDELADIRMLLPLIQSDWWVVMFLVAVFGAPLSEEMLFRGFLFPAIAKTRLGLAGAAVVTSAFWSLLHAYSIPGMLTIFVMGLALAYILWRTGSLWVCIAAHGVYNAIVIFVVRYLIDPVSGGLGIG